MNENAVARSEIATTAVPSGGNTAPPVAAASMLDLFGKPALLSSEDPNLYDALLSRIVAAARPRDPFEWMLLKDYADLAWEILRLRRAKADHANGMRTNALCFILEKLALDPKHALLFHKSPDAKAAVLKQFALHGLDEDIITAEALVCSLHALTSLDAMIKSAETRRNAMLREIDYHRGGLATRLRDAPDVVDAESEDVPRIPTIPERPRA